MTRTSIVLAICNDTRYVGGASRCFQLRTRPVSHNVSVQHDRLGPEMLIKVTSLGGPERLWRRPFRRIRFTGDDILRNIRARKRPHFNSRRIAEDGHDTTADGVEVGAE
jgi:hypothetical protein